MTHVEIRKETKGRLPAVLLMAVVLVIGLAMALVTTQNVYADESGPTILEDDKMLPGESVGWYMGDEFYYSEYDEEAEEDIEHVWTLKNAAVKNQTPEISGKTVARITKEDDQIRIEAVSLGQATIEFTCKDENNKSKVKQETLYVVSDRYEVQVNGSLAGNDDYDGAVLPGETLHLQAKTIHVTRDGEKPVVDGLTYDWDITLDEYYDEGIEPSDIFTMQEDPADSSKVTLKFKSKSQIINNLEMDPDNDIDFAICVDAKAKYNGEEVGSTRDMVFLKDTIYDICKPEERLLLFDDNKKSETVTLKVYEYTGVDLQGNRVGSALSDNDVTYSWEDQDDLKVTRLAKNKIRIELADEDTIQTFLSIGAKFPDVRYEEDNEIYQNIGVIYKPADLSRYDIAPADWYFGVNSNTGTVSLSDLGIKVFLIEDFDIEDIDLDPKSSDYDLEFQRVCFDDEGEEYYESATPPLGIHGDDRPYGESWYRVKAIAKSTSEYRGETDWSEQFAIYNKSDLKNAILSIDQEQTDWGEFGEDNDYDFVWDEERNPYPYEYGRYPVGVEENPVLRLRDDTILTREQDYEIKYYERRTDVDNPEEYLGDPISFPTEPGTYLAKATAKGGTYNGTCYFAFDITVPLVTATVTGVVNKTYTGNFVRQDKKAVKVKLDGRELVCGTDYDLSYDNNQDAGTATMYVTGINKYSGSITKTFKINQAKNPIVIKGKTVKLKAKKVKKKKQTISLAKAFKITKKHGKLTFKKVKGSKKISVAKNGKITVKKGLKKGTYKVKVKVTVTDPNYITVTKPATVKIKIK